MSDHKFNYPGGKPQLCMSRYRESVGLYWKNATPNADLAKALTEKLEEGPLREAPNPRAGEIEALKDRVERLEGLVTATKNEPAQHAYVDFGKLEALRAALASYDAVLDGGSEQAISLTGWLVIGKARELVR